MTLGNHIYLADGDHDDFGTLAHEVTHAWQYQKYGSGEYYRRAVNDRVEELSGGDPYNYLPLKGRPFDKLDPNGLERQAQIIGDCVRGNRGACWAAGFSGDGGLE